MSAELLEVQGLSAVIIAADGGAAVPEIRDKCLCFQDLQQ